MYWSYFNQNVCYYSANKLVSSTKTFKKYKKFKTNKNLYFWKHSSNAYLRLLRINLDPPHACIFLSVALTLSASKFLFTTNIGMDIGSKAGTCILGIPIGKYKLVLSYWNILVHEFLFLHL